MKGSAAEGLVYNMVSSGRDLEQYYSVEIPMFRLNTVYQFRIWDIDYMSLSVLINERSELLNWIKVGDRLKMRLYSHDPGNPYRDRYSELIYIERQERGPMRGHYLVGIEIMDEQRDIMASWPYRPIDWSIIPFSMWSRDYAG